jgi:hypothetical protein
MGKQYTQLSLSERIYLQAQLELGFSASQNRPMSTEQNWSTPFVIKAGKWPYGGWARG